jgi:hypothetical protein
MSCTKEEIRQIVREELERIMRMYLEAKGMAIAIDKGLFFSERPSSPSHNKSAHQRKSA